MEFRENALTLEIYRHIRSRVDWLNFSQSQASEAIARSLYSLVIFDGDQAVGMGRIVGDGVYDLICDVCIDPDYQGRGLGKELVTRLVRYGEERVPVEGRTCMMLFAAQGKDGFYEKIGFESVPNDRAGSGMRIIFRK